MNTCYQRMHTLQARPVSLATRSTRSPATMKLPRAVMDYQTAVQMIAVPVASSPGKSPFKLEQATVYKTVAGTAIPGSPMMIGTPQKYYTTTKLLSTPQRGIVNPQIIAAASPRGTQMVTTVIDSPQQWASRKRTHDLVDPDYSDGKRGKKGGGDKGGKGLRHFSMKVCEKVQKKGVTSYNEVADELVTEFSDPRTISPTDQAYDQKNIRRRVYDALNVLMAMNIISKEKKEIRWIGLPTNSAQECQNLEIDKQCRLARIKQKTQQLQELILQQIAFKNLVRRNREQEQTTGTPAPNSAIQLPFIIVNTNKKTVIDCSISNDKYEYLFNFDNTFEIHDDIEVLKRMGMAFGLEKGTCGDEDVRKAVRMVPKSLEPYVLELAAANSNNNMSSMLSSVADPSLSVPGPSRVKQEPLALPLLGAMDHSNDSEVAMATSQAWSRQSSVGSFSDLPRDSPSDPYSDASDSERSSPVDLS